MYWLLSYSDTNQNPLETTNSSTKRFQSKALHMTMDAQWYVPNRVIWKNLQIPTVKHEISCYSYHYSKCLSLHPNEVILNLKDSPETRQLRKHLPIDLPARFSM
jgi:hypothetical protein